MIRLTNFTDDNRLFTYKVAHDGGNAPNPFYGACTLAICKPAIRRVAKKGDVIVGLDTGSNGSRIIYCMVVDDSMIWEKYIETCNYDKNFNGKIPKNSNDQGDCIWKNVNDPVSLPSWSTHNGIESLNSDITRGHNVLIGKIYWYFGKGDKYKIELPDCLKSIIPGRGHRSNSNNEFREAFIEFFNKALVEKNITKTGKLGTPSIEPKKVDKWACSRAISKNANRMLSENNEIL